MIVKGVWGALQGVGQELWAYLGICDQIQQLGDSGSGAGVAKRFIQVLWVRTATHLEKFEQLQVSRDPGQVGTTVPEGAVTVREGLLA